jgi:NitT/TauT family transport system ATP-binding protein
MGDVLIEVKRLSKTYQTQKKEQLLAIKEVTFKIYPGEFVSVVGPSGCGKSTLLKIIGGLLPKTSGDIFLENQPVEGPRKDIGIVFQEPVLLPWRTVLENTILPIEIQRLDVKAYESVAIKLLEMVGLEGFENKYPFELSGGMQQRNAITRALIHDPKILLMDEPFGALDAMTREQMNIELLKIWRKSQKTIFFITHSIPEAIFLSDRVIVFSQRPGTIAQIIETKLPRPRTLEMMNTEAFGKLSKKIREHFPFKSETAL